MQRRKAGIYITFLLIGLLYGSVASAAQCNAKSDKHRVALLELYTSEGCSSCPPADEWLSGLAARGFGADKVLPLSMHVDYWNYIGWKDPYSAPEYTQRQRQIAQRNRLRSIYTPQLVFNGRDYRSWRQQNLKLLLDEVNAWPAAADLALSWENTASLQLKAKVTSTLHSTKADDATLFIAVYENRLRSDVRAGENSGRELKHDHVVRKMYAVPFAGKRTLAKTIGFQLEPDWNRDNLGLAVFVQQQHTGEVLQALSHPLRCQS